MTLEDAIVYYSESAKECRRKARIESNDYMDMKDSAYEAEQLAGWLNELKVLRERINAQPEIIRCKDCKWSDWYDSTDGNRYCYCMETGAAGRTADDFAVMRKGERMSDLISRQNAIDALHMHLMYRMGTDSNKKRLDEWINNLPSAQPDENKYEYHYDHTDCIWYRPEARNRCPVTCAQYRDGWNDAMNYIFRDGKGYKPYRRDKQYGE